ncbi:unnamed protein product [Notodromas monacha]|uniref:Sodium-coupled monocarboxylate transporter 1 n=1 Tax=Notodromas monacha TaxID=399045 RepID=A0A7R9BWK8_9CRUS|nr:unnamed protein product [Notodromas monacha]CAG0923130.1 unnamed protein product [Notodromas monacha]
MSMTDNNEHWTSTPFPTPETDLAKLRSRFSAADYAVFAGLLAVSAFIGVYYGFFKRKQNNSTADFLMAGRSMGVFPMAMSLMASFMSAITLLGTPAEVYQYGTMYWFIGVSYFLVIPGAAYLYLPVFYQLELTSAYEACFYLELRFNRVLRCTGSGIFVIQMVMYMAIVVYAPALALSQVTGMNVYLSVCLIFGVCAFYTVLGGMKAVMWTDTVQVIIMYAAMIGVVIKGAADAGGIGEVIRINQHSGRLALNFSGDIRERHTLWSTVLGGYFTWIAIYGVNQAQVQRYLTVPKQSMAIKYEQCDPLTVKTVSKSDQLFPLFVMDTLGEISGVPGIFVAGIFSGALSTVSSGVNSLAAIALEDFVKQFFWKNMTQSNELMMSKILSLVFALVSFGLVFVAEQLGDVLQAALSIFGMVGGPLLGLFTLGMFFPWANSKGAACGALAAICTTFWIGFGAQVVKAKGYLVLEKMPISATCLLNQNSSVTESMITSTMQPEKSLEWFPLLELYGISYMWYAAIGCFTVIIVGMLVSLVTTLQDTSQLDPRVISPVMLKIMGRMPEGFRRAIAWNIGHSFSPQDEGKGMFQLGDTDGSLGKIENRSGIFNSAYISSPEEVLDNESSAAKLKSEKLKL